MSIIKIEKLNLGGIGKGPSDNGDIVEVPFSLPGDHIRIEETNFGPRLQKSIIKNSPYRVTPICPQFGVCGGCSLQHGSDSFVTAWKRKIIENSLASRGLNIRVSEVFTSAQFSRRRAVFTGRRTKKKIIVGFNSRGTDMIVPLDGCVLLHHDIQEFFPALEKITSLGTSRKGKIRIHVSLSNNGLDVLVQASKDLDEKARAEIITLSKQYSISRFIWGNNLVVSLAPPVQFFGKVEVIPPALFFTQATVDGQNFMVNSANEALTGSKNVLDLFCGIGTFSASLCHKFRFLAVDHSKNMIEAIHVASKKSVGIKPIDTQVRNLYKNPILENELDKFDSVILDPPRCGALEQYKILARSSIKNIVAVSCNPVTFARDAEILVRRGFKVRWVKLIDQFRWSHHIEVMANFKKN